MLRALRRFWKKLRCRRHRWRPDRRNAGRVFCDLCGARKNAD